MAIYKKINQFSQDLANKVHNLGSDSLTIALTSLANKPVASNSILSNLVQISYANLPTSRVLTTTSCLQSNGTTKLIVADKVLTATGDVAGFDAVVLYNDTPTSPVDPLICWWEYGSDLVLHNTDTFTIDFDDSNGVLQIA